MGNTFSCSVWNLFAFKEGEMQAEGVWEWDAEEDVWA